jgi:hypothetical protein
LQNSVDVGKVFPDEAANPWVFGDNLIGAIGILIAGDWTFYGDIINKQYSE